MNIRICVLWLIFISAHLIGITTAKKSKGKQADVLILGAGIAGVTAAKILVENKLDSFLILEGTDRVGGRIKEGTIGTTTVQTGASWITGTTGNPMHKLAMDNDIKWVKNDFDDWLVVNDNGIDVTAMADPKAKKMFKAFKFATELRKKFLNSTKHPDYTFSSAMAMGGWIPKDAIDDIVEYYDVDFVTGQPGDLSSVKYFYGTNAAFPYKDEELYVLDEKRGLSVVVRNMLDDIPDGKNKLRLNTVVKSIRYNKNGVVVQTSKGKFTGKFAIVTFSLGVLQNRAVKFVPALPIWKQQAIFGFTWSTYSNIFLRFPSTGDWFVPKNTEWTLYASERRGYYPLWQNIEKHIPGSRLMHCTVSYEESKRLHRMTDSEVKAEAMTVLRTLFGSDIPDAEEILFERWLTNPFYYGSYPSWPPGFNQHAFSALKAPVGPLYFAGDAYHDDFGYTNGAYLASIRETTKLVKCLKNNKKCENFKPLPYFTK